MTAREVQLKRSSTAACCKCGYFGGEPLPLQAKLRLDHGALTSLMVCVPTPDVIRVVNHILEQHDMLEEQEGGMYEACAKLTQNETRQILETLRKTTRVPVHPFNEAAYVIDVTKCAVARAGFDFDEIVKGSGG